MTCHYISIKTSSDLDTAELPTACERVDVTELSAAEIWRNQLYHWSSVSKLNHACRITTGLTKTTVFDSMCKNEAYRVVLLTMHAADITICSSVSDWTEYRVSFSFLIMGFMGAFWWHLFESQALWVTGNPIFFSTDNSPAYVVLLLLRLEENRTPHWRERSDCKVITLKDTQGRQVINSCENATFGWGVLVVFKSIWARIDDAPRGFTGALGIPQCC